MDRQVKERRMKQEYSQTQISSPLWPPFRKETWLGIDAACVRVHREERTTRRKGSIADIAGRRKERGVGRREEAGREIKEGRGLWEGRC
jgi:hypothetical protein